MSVIGSENEPIASGTPTSQLYIRRARRTRISYATSALNKKDLPPAPATGRRRRRQRGHQEKPLDQASLAAVQAYTWRTTTGDDSGLVVTGSVACKL